MNFKRGIMLAALGAGAVLAYQNMPNKTKRKVEGAIKDASRMAENKLDNMM